MMTGDPSQQHCRDQEFRIVNIISFHNAFFLRSRSSR